MNKKVVVLGGGTGLSFILKGLKQFPIDISAVVSVCDDGKSTGKLRKEFNTPAVGDIRKVITALSEKENLIEKLFNYRFETTSDLDGHTVGNLLLTAMINMTGNMSEGIKSLNQILNLKGKVLPLTEDNVILMAKMEDNSIIEGEHNITKCPLKIKEVFYKQKPEVSEYVLDEIKEADCIVLSMGSLFTSIFPNLICKEVIKEIDKSNAKILYVCNMMTQPGETDDFKVSDHIKLVNKQLGKRKLDYVIVNNGIIDDEISKKYETLEQKTQVIYDKEETKKCKVKVIKDNFVSIEDEIIRHDTLKLAFHIFSVLIKE